MAMKRKVTGILRASESGAKCWKRRALFPEKEHSEPPSQSFLKRVGADVSGALQPAGII